MSSIDSQNQGLTLSQKVAIGAGVAGSFSAISAGFNALIASDDRDTATKLRNKPHEWQLIAPAKLDAAALPKDDVAALDAVRSAYTGKVAGVSKQFHASGRDVWHTTNTSHITGVSSVAHGPAAALDATRELARTSGVPAVAISLDGQRHFIGSLDGDLATGLTYPSGVNSPGHPPVDFTRADTSIAAVIRSGDQQPQAARGATIAEAIADSARLAENKAAEATHGLRVAGGLGVAALGLGALAIGLATRD